MNATHSRFFARAALALGLVGCRETPRAREPSPPQTLSTGDESLARADASAPVDAIVADAVAAPPTESLRACAPGEPRTPEVAEMPQQRSDAVWRVRETLTADGLPAPQAGVLAECAAFSRSATTARAVLAPLLAARESLRALFEDVGRCHFVAGGAWVIAAGAARVRSARDSSGQRTRVGELPWSVMFVRADGARVRAPALSGTMIVGDALAQVRWGAFHDFDRDGISEAALVETSGNPETGDPERTTGRLLTYARGLIVPYPRGTTVDAAFALDADRDGDPDFVQPSAFFAANTCGPSVFFGPGELATAEADGTFRLDGPASREFLRVQCEGFEQPPTRFFDQPGVGGEAPFRVACWRYWGASSDALLRLIEREWPADGDDHCTSREQTVRAARSVEPRYRLAAPCR
jgi:hypothetical protein